MFCGKKLKNTLCYFANLCAKIISVLLATSSMNKLLFSMSLLCFSLQLQAGNMTLETQVSTTVPTNLGAYCNGVGAYNSAIPSACTTVDFGALKPTDTHFPCGGSGNPSEGYCVDNVTFTSNTLGGETLSATDGGTGTEFSLKNKEDPKAKLSYYVTYQSCQSSDITHKIGSDPLIIPMSQAAEFPATGQGSAPCSCNGNSCTGTPGQGQGALYFYVNDGQPITTPLAAGTYAGTLTITQSAE